MQRQALWNRLYLSGIDGRAAALARENGLGLEIAAFCYAPNLEDPAVLSAVRADMAELEEANGVLELQRSDLAQRFGCVPSQINYVMSTRFSPEHGYIVESRRGGGGYIRITRVQVDRHTLLMHVINSVGDTLDLASARAILSNLVQSQAVDKAVGQTLLWALSDNSLRAVPKAQRDTLRANIFKQVLIHLV